MHDWLGAQRLRVADGTATAKAIDYSLNRWAALTRYLGDPSLPIDNCHDEQQIRPWALGRSNWLFAGTLAVGRRAAAITSLIQSANSTGTTPMPTSRTCSRGCRRSAPARSTRCCRIAGRR